MNCLENMQIGRVFDDFLLFINRHVTLIVTYQNKSSIKPNINMIQQQICQLLVLQLRLSFAHLMTTKMI